MWFARPPRPRTAARLLPLLACAALSGCLSERAVNSRWGPRVDDSLARDMVVVQPFQLDVHLGLRDVQDDEAWEPVDDHLDVGVTIRTPIPSATRAAFDLGVRYGYDESERGTTEVESQIIELDAGLLFAFADPGTLVQPYVGAGLALVFVDNETTVDTAATREREAALGRYLRTGLAVEFRPAQLVGLELRYLDGDDVQLDGRDIALEAYTVALTFGARF